MPWSPLAPSNLADRVSHERTSLHCVHSPVWVSSQVLACVSNWQKADQPATVPVTVKDIGLDDSLGFPNDEEDYQQGAAVPRRPLSALLQGWVRHIDCGCRRRGGLWRSSVPPVRRHSGAPSREAGDDFENWCSGRRQESTTQSPGASGHLVPSSSPEHVQQSAAQAQTRGLWQAAGCQRPGARVVPEQLDLTRLGRHPSSAKPAGKRSLGRVQSGVATLSAWMRPPQNAARPD